uniref:Uncharacterized protein n=1 Tax=Arundo donax TaxID=35708 RepID=A0A0A9CFK5_ARUDO
MSPCLFCQAITGFRSSKIACRCAGGKVAEVIGS